MRERLLAFEAERLAAGGAEENLVYDRKGRLFEKREILRLRRDRAGWSLTFKGSPTFEDGVKIRSERETKVENGDEVHAISAGPGLRGGESATRRSAKSGGWGVSWWPWTTRRSVISSSSRAAAPPQVARRCEFDVEQAEMRTYLELYEDYRREHPEAPPDMVFS